MSKHWKEVEGCPNYLVSSAGRVKNLKLGIVLKQSLRNGYLRVSINGKGQSVHRLVAQAFIPNPNGFDTVDHINGDKTDNRAENLRWISRSDNVRRFYKEQITEDQKANRRMFALKVNRLALEAAHKATKKPVICLENGKTYESVNQAGRELEVNPGNICKVLKGKFKQTNGYHFIYAKEK